MLKPLGYFLLSTIVVAILSVFFFTDKFFTDIEASNLNRAYLFFERMQIDSESSMVLMISPDTDFESGGVLTITFLTDIGEWCLDDSTMQVEGAGSSPVDISPWDIDFALPTESSFEGICIPGDPAEEVHDSIVVQNLGEMDAGLNYGLRLDESEDFRTSSIPGTKRILIELNDGINSSSEEIAVSLTSSDSVSFSAFVSDISTITCSISESNISFGSLPRDGNYVVEQHFLETQSNLAEGYYWAVFGQGDGSEAGLWKSTVPTSLIPSTGNTTIDLSANLGFGLNVSSSSGTIPEDFNSNPPGVFGSINSGSANSRLIFYESTSSSSNLTVTLGARAGLSTETGPHSENLTYFCGGLY